MTESAGKDQFFIAKLTEITIANLENENFGAKELSLGTGMSQYRLSRRLHEITGKTINHFIREVRLYKALEMLKNEDITVSEVAYKVGFGSPTYFNTCFNEFFGFPPGKTKKTDLNNVEGINAANGIAKKEQKRSSKRTFIISSGILFLAALVYLVYCALSRYSSHNEDNNTVKDIDGNIYHTIKIGTQVWLKEDLKTTRYNDGTAIPYVTNDTEWVNLKTGAYRRCNNDDSNKAIYGALYNWYTLDNGKLCPSGWHIPLDNEWEALIDYCGGWEIAGGKLKEAGTQHWDAPNVGATNESGFTALPFGGHGHGLAYWGPPIIGTFRSLDSDRAWIYLTGWSTPNDKCCVRCVKDK
jgi:uncharacterized protein (TIGR02145 family)